LLSLSPSTPAHTNASTTSFGTLQWELDSLGDAIHRHVALRSPEECDEVVELILSEAEKMGHHPHIARVGEGGDEAGGSCMTVTCTTHSPRGLSARDTRLAARVNEVLAGYEPTQPVDAPKASEDQDQDPGQLQRRVAAMRGRALALNRQKILEALESCACSTRKP